MSDRPSTLRLQHVLTALKDVVAEWHDLGIHLGLPESILKLIGSSPDIEGHLRMMVSKWLDYDPEASWDKLANALNTIGKNTIAANIRSKYVGAAATALDMVDTTTDDDSKTRQEINRNILQMIKGKFASLQLQIRLAMEARSVKVGDAHQYLVTSFQGDCRIPEAPDLTKLFNFVTEANLWRYDHYVPLQQLAQQFLHDDEQIRKDTSEYRNRLSGFLTTTRIIDFVKLSELDESEDGTEKPFLPEKYKKYYRILKVKLKLDKKITELTLSHVNTLWQSLAEEFDLPSLTAVIDKIIDGSLVISWLILPHIADKIRASSSRALRFYQRLGIVEVLIDDIQLYDEDWIAGSTPLYQASFVGNTSEVKELLEGGADVNERNNNEYRDTALFGACRGRHAEIARILLDFGASVDLQNELGETSLMLASVNDARGAVSVLLEAKADPNITDEDGETALHDAAWTGEVEIMSLLVKHGAVVDIRDKDGWTGLMHASLRGFTETVSVLLAAKADSNITTENGDTALHLAAWEGEVEVINLLMSHGAAVDTRDKNGWTGLIWASAHGSTETVSVLLAAKADPNSTDENGSTSLMYASFQGFTETVSVLLEAKADPNITNENGLTALHLATTWGEIEVINLLVKHGAAVDIRGGKDKLTALEIARVCDNKAACGVLKQYTTPDTKTELTKEQKESIYQRLLNMVERTFLKERVKKREELQEKNRLKKLHNRPGQIIGTAPAPEK